MKWKVLLQMNRLVNSSSVHGMIEREYYYSVNVVFTIICAFLVNATAFPENEELTKVDSLSLYCSLKYMEDVDVVYRGLVMDFDFEEACEKIKGNNHLYV